MTPHQLDTVLDHLYELNDETPVVRISRSQPLAPELVFGLDTKLFERAGEEAVDWEGLGTGEKHMDEVESRSVWRGGGRPGKRGKKRDVSQVEDTAVQSHRHADGEACACEEEPAEEQGPPVQLVSGEVLHAELAKLPFEIYRGMLPLLSPFVRTKTLPRSERLPPHVHADGARTGHNPHPQLGLWPRRGNAHARPRRCARDGGRQLSVDGDGRSGRGRTAGEGVGRRAGWGVCVIKRVVLGASRL